LFQSIALPYFCSLAGSLENIEGLRRDTGRIRCPRMRRAESRLMGCKRCGAELRSILSVAG
jgi:hypothetical protein